MDPDLVRQQEEEEAASRDSLHKPRLRDHRSAATEARIEPVLPMTLPPVADRAAPPEPRIPDFGTPSAGPSTRHPGLVRPAPGWGTALRGASSLTVGALAGLIGGIMLGVKLQLVPWQSAAIGTLAGLLLGWQIAARALRRHGGMGPGRALRRAILPALIAYLALGAAMFLVPFLSPIAPGPALVADIATFWKAVAGGAVVAMLLSAALLRRAMRKARSQPG